MEVKWDYTERAGSYDKRADYSTEAIGRALELMKLKSGDAVADIGAGTGKLSVPLAGHGLLVHAVEPNAAMRSHGEKNSKGLTVKWSVGTAEATGLTDHCVNAVLFGSSFNVCDQDATLREVSRIAKPRGWFCCMWNHRNLDDPLQNEIEAIIKNHIADYSYGSRRQDPSGVIEKSGLFRPTESITGHFVNRLEWSDVIEAWRSHATLARQAGEMFSSIIDQISSLKEKGAIVKVPYTTRIWVARLGH